MNESPDSYACDVLGLGATAVDDMLYVDAYPPADVKARVLRRERFLGGLTSIALVAAARLGCMTAYAGVLGDDDYSEYVVSRLREEGVNLDHVVRQAGAGPIHSTIVVGDILSTRNIFFELNDRGGAHPERPDAALIRAARVLLVDHIGIDGMLRAARIAHAAHVPIVSDLELNISPRFGELLDLVDHLIFSRDFACKLTGETQPDDAARSLWTPNRQVVVVTCGAEGAWYVTRDGIARHQAAFSVQTVDTTGCGDVFHGAYAACLARGLETGESVRVAAAVAALKATRSGGHRAIPTRADVEKFLSARS